MHVCEKDCSCQIKALTSHLHALKYVWRIIHLRRHPFSFLWTLLPCFIYFSFIHMHNRHFTFKHGVPRADTAPYLSLWQIEPDCCPHPTRGAESWWKALIKYTRIVRRRSILTCPVTREEEFLSQWQIKGIILQRWVRGALSKVKGPIHAPLSSNTYSLMRKHIVFWIWNVRLWS